MAITLSYVQWTADKRQRKIQETVQWTELRNAMWDMFDLNDPSQYGISGPEAMRGYEALGNLSITDMHSWLTKALRILESQSSNPVLIQSTQCLAHWRNAEVTAKTYPKILLNERDPKETEDGFVRTVSSISRDVRFVWRTLVLDSDEVSATGGRPESKK